MSYSDKNYALGDKVWYEAENGNRHLMVVKNIRNADNIDLYPHKATSSLLENKSESKFIFISKFNISPAKAVTDGNLVKAQKVAEIALKRAVAITEAKGHTLSYAQKNFISEAIVQGFLEMKEQFADLEASGFFENLKL